MSPRIHCRTFSSDYLRCYISHQCRIPWTRSCSRPRGFCFFAKDPHREGSPLLPGQPLCHGRWLPPVSHWHLHSLWTDTPGGRRLWILHPRRNLRDRLPLYRCSIPREDYKKSRVQRQYSPLCTLSLMQSGTNGKLYSSFILPDNRYLCRSSLHSLQALYLLPFPWRSPLPASR